uniref:Uncharacterized protein n=1 Tax=Anopheles merus TaxID=30066 RepID=A0A182VES7_ANOME
MTNEPDFAGGRGVIRAEWQAGTALDEREVRRVCTRFITAAPRMAGARKVRKGNFHTIMAVARGFPSRERTQQRTAAFPLPATTTTRERVGVLRDHAIDGQRPNQFGPNRTGSQPTVCRSPGRVAGVGKHIDISTPLPFIFSCPVCG